MYEDVTHQIPSEAIPIPPIITTKPLISPGLPEYIVSPPAITPADDPIAMAESRRTKMDSIHRD